MSESFAYIPFAALFNDPYECIVAAEFELGLNRTVSHAKEFIEKYPSPRDLPPSVDEQYADVVNIWETYQYTSKDVPFGWIPRMNTFTFECMMMFGYKRLFYPNDKKLQRYVNWCRMAGIDIIHFAPNPDRFTSASLNIGDAGE